MNVWAIVLVVAGLVAAANALVVALCVVAARSDATMEAMGGVVVRRRVHAGGEAGRPGGGAGEGRVD